MISKRIKEIAKLIDNQYSVIDIGCDHGYLAEALRKQGNRCPIICCDEKKGPLENAKRNLIGYSDIEFYLSDGVLQIDQQMEVAVMCGIGHHTVEHIMESRMDYFHNCQKIVIGVHLQVDQMRLWLANHHFKIVDEIIIEDYKYYEVLVVENGEMQLNALERQFGPILLSRKDELFQAYWNHTKQKLQTIRAQLAQNHPDCSLLDQKIAVIEDVLQKKESQEK